MSNIDELEEYDAELELRLKKEYADVYGLFRYCVLTQEATYLCNQLDLRIEHQPSYPMIHVAMEDVWVWDKNRPTRIIPRTDIHTTQDVTIEELRPPESTPPLEPPPSAVALDAARGRRRQHADAPRALARRRARAHVAHRDAPAAHDRRPRGAARRAARAARPRHGRGRARSSCPRPCRCSRSRGAGWARARSAVDTLLIGPGVRSGMPILMDNPREVGPDRIVNAVAALARVGGPVHRRRLRHVDELRRRLGGGRVRGRRARAGRGDLDGGALRPRGARSRASSSSRRRR